MKDFLNKIQYAVIFAVLVSVSSCADALDIDPEDSLTQSEIYNDYKDMYTIKLGLYDILQGVVEQAYVLGELRGDLVAAGPGAKGLYVDVADFIDNNVFAGINEDNKYNTWDGFYLLINQCNDALVKYPVLKLKQPKLETDENLAAVYKHIVGETLWLRAWAYFMLVQNWGNVPFYTEPIFTVEQSKQEKFTKPKAEDEILDQLERDLSYAFRYCEYNWVTGQLPVEWNHQTVNMCSVVSLYTDILMYRGKYQQAWDVSSKIVEDNNYTSSFGGDFHALFNISDNSYRWEAAQENPWFNRNFRGRNYIGRNTAREDALIVSFATETTNSTIQELHPIMDWTNNRYGDAGKYLLRPSYPSIQNFLRENDVMRGHYASYLIDDQYVAGQRDTIIWKWVGISCITSRQDEEVVAEIYRRGGDRVYGCGDYFLYRTAGLWLRAAEAANRIGLNTKAITLMNQVRNRVGVGPSSIKNDSPPDVIEDAIIEERALELAYEGYRWYDLVTIAKRRNDPDFLIEKVVQKYPQAKRAQMRARLQAQQTGIGSENPEAGSGDNKNWWRLPYPNKN